MKKNQKEFFDAQSGSALTIQVIRSKNKLGIGKKNKGGYIDFYVPYISTKLENEKLIIKEFQNLTKAEFSKIEIIPGKNDNYIVMILGINSEELNQIIDRN